MSNRRRAGRFTSMAKRAAAAAAALALCAACSTLEPPAATAPLRGAGFSHADLDAFLRRHVDDDARVDYAAAACDRADLDRYLARLAAVSPDNDPERFPTDSDRLAYWINAYNASVIALVLSRYPIASVMDVRTPVLFRFLPSGAGFFLFHQGVLGGRRVTLYGLEHRVIRRRFPEPRVHFALNCASRGCPRLSGSAFSSAGLEAELEREARRFVAEERNVRVDLATRTLHLSSLFEWYERDFLRWLAKRRPEAERSLHGYVLLYASGEKQASIRACAGCEVAFLPYDWGLNDQRAHAPHASDRAAKAESAE